MSPHRAVTLLFLSSFVVSACSGTDAPSFQGSTETLNGVRIVSNPAPVFGALPADSLQPTWLARVDDGDDVWGQPTRLRVGADGLFIVDRVAAAIHRVTFAGEVRPSLGKEGPGPGEVHGLRDAIPLTDGRLIVVDQEGAERWSATGELEEDLMSSQFPGTTRQWGEDEALIYDLDPEAMSLVPTILNGSGQTRAVTFPTLPPRDYETVEAGCRRYEVSDDGFWTVRCGELALYHLSAAEEVDLEARTPDEPDLLSDADLDEVAQRIRTSLENVQNMVISPGMVDQMVEQQVGNLTAVPRYASVRIDQARHLIGILEQTTDTFGASNATLHLFSDRGIYLQALAFGIRWVDFQLDDGRIFALEEDPDLGLVTLARYDVPFSPDDVAAVNQALR